MKPLSEREYQVAIEYCKGLTDKEVADNMERSEWTIKAQKRDIYRKLGISKDTELVIYMFCDRMKVNFDLKEIRKHGIELFFSVWFLILAFTPDCCIDMRRSRVQCRARTSIGVTRAKRESDLMFAA